MTTEQIQTAINEGIPFQFRMADGTKHDVLARHQIVLSRTKVVVTGRDETPHILPLADIAGIRYLKRKP